jgi:predicted extracellular nuclease
MKKNCFISINPIILVGFIFNYFLFPPFSLAGITCIHAVQGPGAASPVAGEYLSVRGVVVGDFQSAQQLKGFFLQETSPDENPATSEGNFVYHDRTDVAVGDRVELTGRVAEYNGLTEITGVQALSILERNADLPPPAELRLPVPALGDLERFEGMRVALPQTLTVSDIGALAVYGSAALSHERPMQPTAVADPGE